MSFNYYAETKRVKKRVRLMISEILNNNKEFVDLNKFELEITEEFNVGEGFVRKRVNKWVAAYPELEITNDGVLQLANN